METVTQRMDILFMWEMNSSLYKASVTSEAGLKIEHVFMSHRPCTMKHYHAEDCMTMCLGYTCFKGPVHLIKHTFESHSACM